MGPKSGNVEKVLVFKVFLRAKSRPTSKAGFQGEGFEVEKVRF